MFRSSSLIEEIRKKRCLWDSAYKQPSDRGIRARQWLEVGENLFTDWNELNAQKQNERVQDVKRKWKNIRDYYKKGSKRWFGKKYVYSHLLDFLDEEMEPAQNRTMCDISRVCIFCTNKGQKLISFTDQTLKKCRKISTIRKKHNLSQKGIIFPEKPSDFRHYHINCYQRFTDLPPRYRIGSSVTTDATSPLNTDIQKPEINIPLIPIQITEKLEIESQSESICEIEDMPLQEIEEAEEFLANIDVPPKTAKETSLSPQPNTSERCLPMESEHDNANQHYDNQECLDADRCFLLSLLPEMRNMDSLQKITFKISVLNEMRAVMMRQDQSFTIKEEPPYS